MTTTIEDVRIVKIHLGVFGGIEDNSNFTYRMEVLQSKADKVTLLANPLIDDIRVFVKGDYYTLYFTHQGRTSKVDGYIVESRSLAQLIRFLAHIKQWGKTDNRLRNVILLALEDGLNIGTEVNLYE